METQENLKRAIVKVISDYSDIGLYSDLDGKEVTVAKVDYVGGKNLPLMSSITIPCIVREGVDMVWDIPTSCLEFID